MMKEQKVKMNELKCTTISHKGKCFRNTKASPGSAEEHACADAASLLLLNQDGNMLENDEGIFAAEIAGDGDTRGGLNFIDRQCEIIGLSAANLPQLMPHAGHFIKCISNGFCSFKEKHKEHSGVNLLDPNRIRSMPSDVSRHLKTYHVINEKLLKKEEIIALKNRCLKRIDSIAPYHCGNHTNCTISHCKCEPLELAARIACGLVNEKKDLLSEIQLKIDEKHANTSRFKGASMDVSAKDHIILQRAISSCLPIENADKVAKMLSSNARDHCLAILAKCTEGKRINLDKIDNWIVLQHFIAGARSNINYCKNLRVELGLYNSEVRNEKNKKLNHRKLHLIDCSKKESTIERRKMRKQRRNHLMGKDEKSDSKHATEKMKLKDYAEGEKIQKKRRAITCSNCNEKGHAKLQCVKPIRKKDASANEKNKKEVEEIKKLFR